MLLSGNRGRQSFAFCFSATSSLSIFMFTLCRYGNQGTVKGSNFCKLELCVVLTPASIMQSWVRIPIKGQTFLRPTR